MEVVPGCAVGCVLVIVIVSLSCNVVRRGRCLRVLLYCGLWLWCRLEFVVADVWLVVYMLIVGSGTKLMRRRHAVNSGVGDAARGSCSHDDRVVAPVARELKST